MAPKSRIVVQSHFPKHRKHLHRAIREGVERGSVAGRNAARATAPRGDARRGHMAGHAADTIDALKIQRRSRGGYRAGFGSHDRTILWLALGTKGRRTRKLHKDYAGEETARKQLRETKSGRATGLRPNPWMRRALIDVALPVAISTMRRRASGNLS